MAIPINLKKGVIVCQNYSCSNSCVFCNPRRVRRGLTPDMVEAVRDDMYRQARDLRHRMFDFIEISGCDPIEYPGIVDFVRYLKKDLGFFGVQLSTHGRLLRDAGLVKALKTVGLDIVKIPLYGSRAGIHDAVTQEKGSFRQTLQGLENVCRLAPKMLLEVASLIMRQNCRDVRDIYRVASRYAVWVSFSVPCISRNVAAERFAVSFAAIRPQLLSLLEDCKKENRVGLVISDIPFCVFEFYRHQIVNLCGPPATARTYRIPDEHRSRISHLPDYRVKVKFPGCARCSLTEKCGGFYQTYAEFFKMRDARPVREK